MVDMPPKKGYKMKDNYLAEVIVIPLLTIGAACASTSLVVYTVTGEMPDLIWILGTLVLVATVVWCALRFSFKDVIDNKWSTGGLFLGIVCLGGMLSIIAYLGKGARILPEEFPKLDYHRRIPAEYLDLNEMIPSNMESTLNLIYPCVIFALIGFGLFIFMGLTISKTRKIIWFAGLVVMAVAGVASVVAVLPQEWNSTYTDREISRNSELREYFHNRYDFKVAAYNEGEEIDYANSFFRCRDATEEGDISIAGPLCELKKDHGEYYYYDSRSGTYDEIVTRVEVGSSTDIKMDTPWQISTGEVVTEKDMFGYDG